MATVTVEVTDKDIIHGERDSCRRCPISLAIQRRLRRGYSAWVGEWDVDFWNELMVKEHRADLPPDAIEFIEDFDNEDMVSPISFPLDIPDELLLAPAEAPNV
jgi:hypothetical protein